MQSKPRVAVIGAGPCGIYMAYALSTMEGAVDFEVLDRQDAPGGQWNFNPNPTDKYGEPTHSCTYENLWINGPKEAFELPIYKFGEDVPSFFPRPGMSKYVLGFMDHFDLRKHIKCGCRVDNVAFNEEKKLFTVSWKNLETGADEHKEYNYVIVATGHFHCPRPASFPGEENYEGKMFHSKYFRNEVQFKDQKILVVGGSYSSEDVALQCYKFQATKVTIVNRRKMGFKWPIGVEEKPFTEIKLMGPGKKVTFTDGTEDEFDVVVKSTGYLHTFPFLDEAIRLNTPNVFNPPLYMQIVFPKNPRIFYMGMQDQFYTMSMFYLQALYIRDVLLGKTKVPETEEERMKWIENDAVRGNNLANPHEMILFQTDYVKTLCDLVGVTENLDYSKDFFKWEQDKIDNLLTYRDQQFPSILTKKMSPPLETPWLKHGDGARQEEPKYP